VFEKLQSGASSALEGSLCSTFSRVSPAFHKGGDISLGNSVSLVRTPEGAALSDSSAAARVGLSRTTRPRRLKLLRRYKLGKHCHKFI
jgi:hypothetical protein